MDEKLLNEKIDDVCTIVSLLYQAPDVGEKAIKLLVDMLNDRAAELKQYMSVHS